MSLFTKSFVHRWLIVIIISPLTLVGCINGRFSHDPSPAESRRCDLSMNNVNGQPCPVFDVVSDVARGGARGPWPPKLLVNFFFCNELMLLRSLYLKCKKNFTELREFERSVPAVTGKTFCHCPPPPPANLVRLWRSRKISATTPPHRIYPASGDHGKFLPLPPPQRTWSAYGDHGKITKILATPLDVVQRHLSWPSPHGQHHGYY